MAAITIHKELAILELGFKGIRVRGYFAGLANTISLTIFSGISYGIGTLHKYLELAFYYESNSIYNIKIHKELAILEISF